MKMQANRMRARVGERRRLPRGDQCGVMLIEALVAILIFSLGVLGIVGMQAQVLRHQTDSKMRIDAAYVADQTVNQIWVDRGNLSGYLGTNQSVPSLPNGSMTVTKIDTDADPLTNRLQITITWRLPGEATSHSYVYVTDVNTNS